MNRILVSCFAAVAAAAIAGCVPLGSQGSLQNGTFAYVCSSEATEVTDVGCTPSFTDEGNVPGAVAVGTHFDLQYNVDLGSGGPLIEGLVPAASSLLSSQPPTTAGAFGFSFTSPGVVAVLATTSGGVADFLHVTGAELDHLAITDENNHPVTSIMLAGGSGDAEPTIFATPFSATKQPLAGGMVFTWSSSDPTVVTPEPIDELFGSSPGNEVTLAPGGTGTATITVSALDAQASVVVTVTGGAP
jgi:hypothetical protein